MRLKEPPENLRPSINCPIVSNTSCLQFPKAQMPILVTTLDLPAKSKKTGC
jgi:hypothetical protein